MIMIFIEVKIEKYASITIVMMLIGESIIGSE